MIRWPGNRLLSQEKTKIMSNFRKIRKFIRISNLLGYIPIICEKHEGSCYVGFVNHHNNSQMISNGSILVDFIFRFSDHELKPWNQIPAGVICERTTLNSSIMDIIFYSKLFNNMTTDEKMILWTNRFAYDSEF